MQGHLVYGRGLSDADPQAAVRLAAELVPAESTRAHVLVRAGQRLMVRRAYPAALAVLRAAEAIPQGKEDASALLHTLQRLERREAQTLDRDDPRTPVRHVLFALFDPNLSAEAELKTHATRELQRVLLPRLQEAQADAARNLTDPAAMESQVLLLDAIAGMPLTVEPGGDPLRGFVVQLGNGDQDYDEDFRARTRAFVVSRQGRLRMIGLSSTPGIIGREILSLIGRGRLDAARRWLDWMAPKKQLWIDFDPFLVPPALVGWTRHNIAGENNARTAAALWLAEGDDIDQRDAARLLTEAADRYRAGPKQQIVANAAIIRADLAGGRADKALVRIDAALRTYSDSASLVNWRIRALHDTGQRDEAMKTARWALAQPNLQLGHVHYHGYLADVADAAGDLTKVEAHRRAAVQQRFAGPSTVRRAIWAAAGAGTIDRLIDEAAGALRDFDGLTLDDRAALAAYDTERGHQPAAIRNLRARSRLTGDLDATAWYLMGRMLERDGERAG
ncbi:MAG: hypothetical protein KC583_02340, partial [Myxococcales bacterium]|nr:hypothetical protein [Myxococcales bacterium]